MTISVAAGRDTVMSYLFLKKNVARWILLLTIWMTSHSLAAAVNDSHHSNPQQAHKHCRHLGRLEEIRTKPCPTNSYCCGFWLAPKVTVLNNQTIMLTQNGNDLNSEIGTDVRSNAIFLNAELESLSKRSTVPEGKVLVVTSDAPTFVITPFGDFSIRPDSVVLLQLMLDHGGGIIQIDNLLGPAIRFCSRYSQDIQIDEGEEICICNGESDLSRYAMNPLDRVGNELRSVGSVQVLGANSRDKLAAKFIKNKIDRSSLISRERMLRFGSKSGFLRCRSCRHKIGAIVENLRERVQKSERASSCFTKEIQEEEQGCDGSEIFIMNHQSKTK